MNYEELLDSAYKNVKQVDCCDRFEILKVEGHHQGIRTVVTNFGRIVTCLRRDPLHLAKFLGRELASSVEIAGDRLVLSRKLSSKEINEKIERYVHQFVLCSKCKKPDTELEDVGGHLYLRCMACGNKQEVHRL